MDGYTYDSDLLKDARKISTLLDEIPDMIKMTKISKSVVTEYTDGAAVMDWGVSGFVLIAESHISIHTFPARNYVNVDVFSCKQFDYIASAETIAGVFGLREYELTLLQRGLEYLNEADDNLDIERKRFYVPGHGER